MTDQVSEVTPRRHSKEWLFFFLSGLLTITILAAILLAAVFRTEIIDGLKADYADAYRSVRPFASDLTNEQVMPLLAPEDQQTLQLLEALYIPVVVIIPIALFILFVFTTGKLYGSQRAQGVRITPEQFPEVYDMWQTMASALRMKRIPELYTVNGDGVLNAFAACVPGFRYFSTVNSDILEACLRNQDWETLKFILGHELGHMKLGHVTWWWFLLTFMGNLPGVNYIFGLPLSRAREYSCDKIGQAFAADDAYKGLTMLGAGKHLYSQLNTQAHLEESTERHGFWMTVSNFFSTHPIVNWRINAVRRNHNGGIFFFRR